MLRHYFLTPIETDLPCQTDTEVALRPPKSPNLNVHMERWFRSLKSECLDRMIFFGRKSLENAFSTTMQSGIIWDSLLN